MDRVIRSPDHPHRQWTRYFNNEIVALLPHHRAQCQPTIVRLRAGDVLATLPTTVHATRVAAAEDLHQRFHFVDRRRTSFFTTRDAVEPAAIGLRHRRNVLGLLLAPFHLEAADAELGDLFQVIVCGQILGADQVP